MARRRRLRRRGWELIYAAQETINGFVIISMIIIVGAFN
jgi:hypothetical protein